MKKIILLFTATFFLIISCSKSSDAPGGNNNGGGGSSSCTGVPNKFAADANPIIQANCATDATCHGAGSINGPGPLLTYTQIFNNRVNIKSAVNSGTMPKVGSLSTAQKSSIICWIDNGALNN